MKIIESRDALLHAILDVAKSAEEHGLSAEAKCFIADHDLAPLSDGACESAALIAGEITVSSPETEEKIVLECALSITEGEVSADEMLREVNTIRDNMREIIEKVHEYGNAKDAFAEMCKTDEPEDAVQTFDNKNF